MKDAEVWAWIASHQLVTYIVILFVAGSLAGLVRKRSDEEWAAFKAKNPYVAQLVEMARGVGIDGPKIMSAAFAIILRMAGHDGGRSLFGDKPASAPPPRLVPPDEPTPRDVPPPPPTGGFV
jgi:hypothetical protein